jgi:phage baseplate assembly protein W
MASSDKTSFLGCGWSFPPTFEASAGGVVMVKDDEDIQQSLRVLFSTLLKERVMLPTYGCGLFHSVFEPADSALYSRIKSMLSNAILYFEARINVVSISIEEDDAVDGLLQITLSYQIRQTNSRSNMVYPFYLQGEGTNVRKIA